LTNFVVRNRSFATVAEDLQARSVQLAQAGRAGVIPPPDMSILDFDVPTFIAQRGSRNVQARFAQLIADSLTNRRLLDEFSSFLSNGRVGARRPDTIEFRLDMGVAEITDPNLRRLPETIRVHQFKTEFYGEVLDALFGRAGPQVSAFDLNAAMGRHIAF
jgi:hypothetical protein